MIPKILSLAPGLVDKQYKIKGKMTSRYNNMFWFQNVATVFLLSTLGRLGRHSTVEAFVSVPQRCSPPRHIMTTSKTTTTTFLPMVTDVLTDVLLSSSPHMTLLATIDADIANIPTNEFRTVFLGGLGVMAGGLLSAVAVGVILEASDGYAAVVAESYDDLEADEAFWQGLSDEEAKKAREMLAKVKQQKGEETNGSRLNTSNGDTASSSASLATETKTTTDETTTSEAETEKKVDMFSDY